MAAFSALLLVTALVASFACASAGVCCLAQLIRGRPLSGRAAAHLVWRLGKRAIGKVPALKRALAESAESRRRAQLKAQMPDALRLLCIALDAGSSLVKALEYAANNVEAPLSTELKRAVWDLQAGQGFDEAMVHLRERTGGSEFAYLAIAMEIQHQSGGSLAMVLKTISGTLRRSAELSESLETQTTQGRLSARIVAAMPAIVLAAVSIFSPSYLAAFGSSVLGAALLVLAVLLEACGIFWVRRALKVDLSAHLGGGAT